MSPSEAEAPWRVTEQKVQAAVRRIVELARPKKIILFGSYVRGEANLNSDLDMLVVVSDPAVHPRKESVRLMSELQDILMPVDILVVPETEWEAWKEAPGLIFREAWTQGVVVYES